MLLNDSLVETSMADEIVETEVDSLEAYKVTGNYHLDIINTRKGKK